MHEKRPIWWIIGVLRDFHGDASRLDWVEFYFENFQSKPSLATSLGNMLVSRHDQKSNANKSWICEHRRKVGRAFDDVTVKTSIKCTQLHPPFYRTFSLLFLSVCRFVYREVKPRTGEKRFVLQVMSDIRGLLGSLTTDAPLVMHHWYCNEGCVPELHQFFTSALQASFYTVCVHLAIEVSSRSLI